jgi:carbon monoxide dehydrogenase subunit G
LHTAIAVKSATRIFSGLQVHKERMMKNLMEHGGLIMAESVMLGLAEKSKRKVWAHQFVHDIAIEVATKGGNFGDAVMHHKDIKQYLTLADVKTLLKPADYIGTAAEQVANVRAQAQKRRGIVKKIPQNLGLFLRNVIKSPRNNLYTERPSMDMTGKYRIPASKQAVWDAMNDPEVLKASIPGCDSVEKISDTELKAKVTLKIGPVKAKFAGDVKLSDMDPPNGYTISGKGKGGAAGFGSGSATVSMTEDGGETILTYLAKASVGGKIAQVGQRLIDSTSKKLADEFFANFVEHLAATGVSTPRASDSPAPDDRETNAAKPEKSNKSWLVIAGIIIIGVIALGIALK